MLSQITGIRYSNDRYYLVDGSHEKGVTKDEMRFYLQKAKMDRNIKDYIVGDNDVVVTFSGPYSPLSSEDIGQLLRPTGVTGILRELDKVES
jgi:hypothetical protein